MSEREDTVPGRRKVIKIWKAEHRSAQKSVYQGRSRKYARGIRKGYKATQQ
jgi:hypothetical protein